MKLAPCAAVAAVLLPTLARAAAPRVAEERILLRTVGGDIVLALYPDAAPRHVAQILRLARLGVYDSTHFFRVIPGFIAQVSDASDRTVPLSPEQAAAIGPLKAEFGALRHVRGVLSMAREPGDPDSAKTSFSILLGDWPEGDGRYTIFGRVESGMDVVDEFLKVPRDAGNRPRARLEILSAEPVRAAELARRRLEPARSVPWSAAPAPAAGSGTSMFPLSAATPVAPAPSSAATAGIAVMTAIGLAGFLARARFPRAAESLHLVNVLVGVFLLLAVLTPAAQRHSALAAALFAGLLGMFKLMSRFESSA